MSSQVPQSQKERIARLEAIVPEVHRQLKALATDFENHLGHLNRTLEGKADRTEMRLWMAALTIIISVLGLILIRGG